MSRAAAYLLVVTAAATPWLEVLLVVPAAILAGLPAGPVVLLAAAGNIATIVPAIYLGERIRGWWQRRRGGTYRDTPGPSGRSGRGRRVFDRYGLAGLALLGPLVTGIHVAALVAVGAGAPRRRTLLWLAAGVTAWSLATGILTVVGIDLIVEPDQLPELFEAGGPGPQSATRSAIQSTHAV